MKHRWGRTLPEVAMFLTFAAASTAERARNPSEATVFIRVVGTAKIEVRGAFSEEREERDVEIGTGSGFVFTPYGHVLTNHHVIESSTIAERVGGRDVEIDLTVDRVEVVMPGFGDTRLDASVEAVDTDLDLAVLSVAGGDLPYLALGDSAAALQGDAVQVYGFPFGRRVEVGKANLPDIVPRVSVSRGSVAAARTDDFGNAAYLQTTATVNPGNSGGPMVDADGYVMGVVRLRLRDADGVGFAIPVNSVKDFLTFNGYDQLLPVTRLRLGVEQTLEGKGLSLALPDTMEDVSPTRLRAFTDPRENAVQFVADRVATRWALADLEQRLLSGGTFGSFQAGGELQSSALGDGRFILGRARGRDVATEEEQWMEYALLEAGLEKLILRYQGHPDEIAFNRSVLLASLQSVVAESLLTNEVTAPLSAELPWVIRPLPAPTAPRIVVPDGWYEEMSAPFACRDLPPYESVLSVSPLGDFTVSFRAGWWSTSLGPTASTACSEQAGALGEGSYAYTVDWLGERYVVEGLIVERGGTLQLEAVALQEKHGFIRDAARAWMKQNQ